jgi:hypothetical protein
MKAHLAGYRGVNLGQTTNAQKEAQQWAKAQMQQRRAVGKKRKNNGIVKV